MKFRFKKKTTLPNTAAWPYLQTAGKSARQFALWLDGKNSVTDFRNENFSDHLGPSKAMILCTERSSILKWFCLGLIFLWCSTNTESCLSGSSRCCNSVLDAWRVVEFAGTYSVPSVPYILRWSILWKCNCASTGVGYVCFWKKRQPESSLSTSPHHGSSMWICSPYTPEH